jgi:hypothetical protein
VVSDSNTPFRITLYDKTLKRIGWVGAYRSLTLTLAHNQVSNAWLTLDGDDQKVAALMTHGARYAVDYEGQRIFNGPITTREGAGPSRSSYVTFNAQSDFRILGKILAWPNPTQDIYHQGYDDDDVALGDYDVQSGVPAETALKHYVTANATRLGIPVTSATDLGRGADVDVSMRFHYLTDRLLPAVDLAGLGVTVNMTGTDDQGTGFEVDVYEPSTVTRDLSEESGILTDWNWSETAPDATRVIVGGQGEGIDRDFELMTDTARETEWGIFAEVFQDARDVELGDTVTLQKRGQQALDDAGPTSGLNLTFAETSTFRYLKSAKVGDGVNVSVAPGVTISNVLRTVTFSNNTSEGLLIVPGVGDAPGADRQDMLVARAIAALARGLRELRIR